MYPAPHSSSSYRCWFRFLPSFHCLHRFRFRSCSCLLYTSGYSHIPQRFAAVINAFCREHLNLYVNLHRPSQFAKEVVDAKGKVRKTYPQQLIQTPLSKLASLPEVSKFLRRGITIEQLQSQAKAQTCLLYTSGVLTLFEALLLLC